MKKYSIETQKVILSALKLYIEYLGIGLQLKLPKNNWVLKGNFIKEKDYKMIMNNMIYEDSFISIRNKEIIKVL